MTQAIEFEELARERRSALDEVTRLEAELEPARARLRDLDAVLEGLRRLGLLREDDAEPELDTRSVAAKALDEIEESERNERNAPTRIRRIRSTNLVANVVNDAGQPVTIDDVMTIFEDRYGFPESWGNPRNAIGNALRRAADKHLIDRFGTDLFVSATRGRLPRAES